MRRRQGPRRSRSDRRAGITQQRQERQPGRCPETADQVSSNPPLRDTACAIMRRSPSRVPRRQRRGEDAPLAHRPVHLPRRRGEYHRDRCCRPARAAGDAPIGHIGDTLRVDTGTYIADVTVSSVAPCDPPPGFGYTRERRSGQKLSRQHRRARRRDRPRGQGAQSVSSWPPTSASTESPRSPTPTSREPPMPPTRWTPSLGNAPNGAIVRGGVYWDAYRDPVSNVVLLDQQDGPAPRAMEHVTRTPSIVATIDSVDTARAGRCRRTHVSVGLPALDRAARTSRRSSLPTCRPTASRSIWPIRSARSSPRSTTAGLSVTPCSFAASTKTPTYSERSTSARPPSCRRCMCCPTTTAPGPSTALMERALATADEWGVRCVWLGVNRENQRAQRFYTKSGFTDQRHQDISSGRPAAKTTMSWFARLR